MAAKKKFTAKDMLADEDLDELLLNPAKLAEVLEKRPPAPRKSKRQSGNKDMVTMARERQNMRSNQSTSTREVLERMLEKNPNLTEPFQHFVDGQMHLVYPAQDGKPAYWVPIAKGDEESRMRQSDRSSRDHANDIQEDAETTERSTVGETLGDEAEMDDELLLNIKVKRQSKSGGDKPYEERHNDAVSDRPFTATTPKKTMRELHPQMFPKPRTVIQSLDLRQLDEIDSLRGEGTRDPKVRQRPADRIRKLESELRETKAVNQQSKQIWLATMQDDINTVENLRLEVARMAQEKQNMQRQFDKEMARLEEIAQDREAARQANQSKLLQEATKPEELNDRHSESLEQLRQEVARMAQEKKDMQRQFEEMWRDAAQETQAKLQATRAFQLQQSARQETHAGELTDEDSDKTEREANVRARSAPPNRRGTPIPEHVQLGRYNSSDIGALAARQESDN